MAKRGRPPLEHKSKACYVRVPYKVNKLLEDYCNKRELTTSQVILLSIKLFLGVTDEI